MKSHEVSQPLEMEHGHFTPSEVQYESFSFRVRFERQWLQLRVAFYPTSVCTDCRGRWCCLPDQTSSQCKDSRSQHREICIICIQIKWVAKASPNPFESETQAMQAATVESLDKVGESLESF